MGNKCDLEDARQVRTQEATAFAARHGMAFEETSALDATGVEKSFHTLITEIYRCVAGLLQVQSQVQDVVLRLRCHYLLAGV